MLSLLHTIRFVGIRVCERVREFYLCIAFLSYNIVPTIRQQQQQQIPSTKISFHVVEFEVSASAMNNTFGCV